jgi:Na+-driven multidrug efflux pump
MLHKLSLAVNAAVYWIGGGDTDRGLVVTAIALSLYFLPAIFATLRRHRQTLAIFMLTLLLGWTMLGWIAAMVWASTSRSTALAD